MVCVCVYGSMCCTCHVSFVCDVHVVNGSIMCGINLLPVCYTRGFNVGCEWCVSSCAMFVWCVVCFCIVWVVCVVGVMCLCWRCARLVAFWSACTIVLCVVFMCLHDACVVPVCV